MARNRKRRSAGRPHRPAGGPGTEPGIATARAARHEDPDGPRRDEAPDETPDPIEHGSPDVELAEAQLALGRPELAGAGGEVSDEELSEEAMGGGGGRGRRRSRGGGRGGNGDGDGDGELAAAPAAHPAPSPGIATRLVHFLQGSWRELQRVQWPDRRQVMQATGVVIGFVIVAGVFLGVADLVANKVVQFILK